MISLAQRIAAARQGQTALISAGQAGFIIKSRSGQLLGIDLYLSDCVERLEGSIGFKRLLPRILLPCEVEFDCLIATHPHFDHFDFDSVPELMSGGRTRLFASTECEGLVKELRMTNDGITYVRPGDTCLRLDRADEYKAFGALDVMIAPINGAFGNMNEEDCARLAEALCPKLTVPCHYGMFTTHGGSPGLFMEAMKQHCPALAYTIMTQGEVMAI